MKVGGATEFKKKQNRRPLHSISFANALARTNILPGAEDEKRTARC